MLPELLPLVGSGLGSASGFALRVSFVAGALVGSASGGAGAASSAEAPLTALDDPFEPEVAFDVPAGFPPLLIGLPSSGAWVPLEVPVLEE